MKRKWVYIRPDEAVISGRRIYCVVFGNLDGTPSVPLLLDICQTGENVNNVNAAQAVAEGLRVLWPQLVLYDNFRLPLTDQASYMLREGENLKRGLFPELLPVACIRHPLSRVCEEVRALYQRIDLLVTNFKNILNRSPRRVTLFEQIAGCKLVSFPVATRWGAWIKFCVFICQNLERIRDFAERIIDDDCSSTGHVMR